MLCTLLWEDNILCDWSRFIVAHKFELGECPTDFLNQFVDMCTFLLFVLVLIIRPQ